MSRGRGSSGRGRDLGIISQVIVLNLHLEGLLELMLTELREHATPAPPYVAHAIVMLPLWTIMGSAVIDVICGFIPLLSALA